MAAFAVQFNRYITAIRISALMGGLGIRGLYVFKGFIPDNGFPIGYVPGRSITILAKLFRTNIKEDLVVSDAGIDDPFIGRPYDSCKYTPHLILLDGVPITDPDGMSRLDFVNSEMVDRIDVVKGPNSTLYGANAAGGVINIITKSLFEETKSAKVGYGSNNTQLYNGTYGTHFGNTYISATGSRRSTDSWREWNEFSTNQGSLKVGYVFSEKTLVEANVSMTKADLQLPGTLTQAQYENDISQLTSEQWRNSGGQVQQYSLFQS